MSTQSEHLYFLLNGATDALDRIYPLHFDKQATFPVIVYNNITSDYYNFLDNSQLDVSNAVFQLDIIAKTYSETETILEQILLLIRDDYYIVSSRDEYEEKLELYLKQVIVKRIGKIT